MYAHIRHGGLTKWPTLHAQTIWQTYAVAYGFSNFFFLVDFHIIYYLLHIIYAFMTLFYVLVEYGTPVRYHETM